MLHLYYAINVTYKLWVVGLIGECIYTWAALRNISDRITGAVMSVPIVSPYEPIMTKQYKHKMLKKWKTKTINMHILATKFPRLPPYFYRRSFLSGVHGHIETKLALSLGVRDKAFLDHPLFEKMQKNMFDKIMQNQYRNLSYRFPIGILALQTSKVRGNTVERVLCIGLNLYLVKQTKS